MIVSHCGVIQKYNTLTFVHIQTLNELKLYYQINEVENIVIKIFQVI